MEQTLNDLMEQAKRKVAEGASEELARLQTLTKEATRELATAQEQKAAVERLVGIARAELAEVQSAVAIAKDQRAAHEREAAVAQTALVESRAAIQSLRDKVRGVAAACQALMSGN